MKIEATHGCFCLTCQQIRNLEAATQEYGSR